MITYQSTGILVTYLQIFLREYFGLSIKKIVPKERSKSAYYEITNSDPIKVTGYWNQQSYSALALYMATNYPHEKYPCLWKRVYDEDQNLTWEKDESFEYSVGNPDMTELISIISSNMENSLFYKDAISVPERVLSYILGEVVTPNSTPEEILRIKKLIYTTPIPQRGALSYDKSMIEYVKTIQQELINRYVNSSGELPSPYQDFKVTGYVDPWTERFIREVNGLA